MAGQCKRTGGVGFVSRELGRNYWSEEVNEMFLAAYGTGGGSYTGYWVALVIIVAIAVALAVWSLYRRRSRRTYYRGTTMSDRRSSAERSYPAA
jgi:hypothetical protein